MTTYYTTGKTELILGTDHPETVAVKTKRGGWLEVSASLNGIATHAPRVCRRANLASVLAELGVSEEQADEDNI